MSKKKSRSNLTLRQVQNEDFRNGEYFSAATYTTLGTETFLIGETATD
jgi:hypothetical protein